MNKMGKGVPGGRAIMIFILLAMLGVIGYGVYFITQESSPSASIITQQALTEEGLIQTTGQVDCPSDGTTDGQIRYLDGLATTVTYKSTPTCYFVPKTAGLERVTAGALSATAFSTAVDLKCTASGTKWRTVCTTVQNDTSSVDEGVDFIAEGSYAKRDVTGKSIDYLKVKIEDKFTGGATYFNETVSHSTAYVVLNGSQAKFADVSGNTALALGTDGYIDSAIYVKTNNTKRQFGEDGLKVWMLVDANADEFSEPIVVRDNGATLVNQIENMQAEDRKKYTGFEYAYDIGKFSDRESKIDFYMQAASGANPSTDPIIEFCAEGRYNSVKQTDTILVGCWTDAATQVEVAVGAQQYFIYDIS